MTRLLLHIGARQSDADLLQQACQQRSAALQQQGILYPQAGLVAGAHHELVQAVGLGAQRIAELAAEWQREADARHCHTVLVSSEGLSTLGDVAALRPLADSFDLQVLVLLRRQDHFLELAYRQQVLSYAQRFTGSVQQLALRQNFHHQLHYGSMLAQWAKVFGAERLQLAGIPTPPEQRCPLPVQLDQLGLPGVFKTVLMDAAGNAAASRQPPTAALPYLARLNALPITQSQHMALRAAAAEMFTADAHVGGAQRLLLDADARQFYGKFGRSNDLLASDWGLDLAPWQALELPPTRQFWVDHWAVDPLRLAELQASLRGSGRLRRWRRRWRR